MFIIAAVAGVGLVCCAVIALRRRRKRKREEKEKEKVCDSPVSDDKSTDEQPPSNTSSTHELRSRLVPAQPLACAAKVPLPARLPPPGPETMTKK